MKEARRRTAPRPHTHTSLLPPPLSLPPVDSSTSLVNPKKSLVKDLRQKASKDVENILSDSNETLAAMETAMTTHFPHSDPTESLRSSLETSGLDTVNASFAASLPAVRALLTTGIDRIKTLERHIALRHPKMEDGNNFGVTVQMTIAKFLQETREGWAKSLDSITKYYSERADAVDKLALAKTSTSESKTVSESTSTGGKDGDQSGSETKTVREESTKNGTKTDAHRLEHLLAIDVAMYSEMRWALQGLIDGYFIVLDNVEKNREKLDEPKGQGGGNNNMGMY